jgi:hypothetical protein
MEHGVRWAGMLLLLAVAGCASPLSTERGDKMLADVRRQLSEEAPDSDAAQYQARAIATSTKAVELRPVGQDVAESNESKEDDVVAKARVAEADRKIVVGRDGMITIPAVAYSKPTGNTAQIISMKSFSGGMQLHSSRDLKTSQKFEYAFEAPAAGKYALTARVVTVQSDQQLLLTPNDAKEPVTIAVPYTIGRWEQTKPVEVALVNGRNVLRFTHPAPSRGLSIKEFTLTPVK